MPIIPHHHESRHRGPKPFYLEAVSKQRDSRVDRLGPSRWQAYHVGLATVRAQSPATTCTAICLLAIDGTEGSKLAATHHTSVRIILSQHPSLRSPARHNDHSPRPYVLSSAFLLGDRRRNQPHYLYLSLEHSAACSFVSAFYLLIWSLPPSLFLPFFSFGYPNALTYLLSPCCSGFYTRKGEGSIDHGEIRGLGFCYKNSSVLSGGLIFAGDEKHAAIDTPLLLPRMDGERSLGKMVRGMVDEY